MTDRSSSRGREGFHSSGRGGLGNIRQSSGSRDRTTVDGPDDFSETRGREPVVDFNTTHSTGRGGAGNIRSPSRDAQGPLTGPDAREKEIIHAHEEADKAAVHSSGRGGLGNMSRSRSRGPGVVHSTGRGGAGNIASGDGLGADLAEDAERKLHIHAEGVHSTGRGGVANLTGAPGPGVEHHLHEHGGFLSSGRGGAGNISRDRSASRDPEQRSKSKDHGVAGFIGKLTHPHRKAEDTPSEPVA